MKRLFAALPIPVNVTAKLCEIQQQLPTGAAVRHTHQSGFHITISFFGSSTEVEECGITNTLEHLASNTESFTMFLDTLGAFPRKTKPKIIWFGMSQVPTELGGLYERSATAFERLGYSHRARFIPHVTLARLKDTAPRLFTLPEASPCHIPVQATELCLYQSQTEACGAKYSIIRRFPFEATS